MCATETRKHAQPCSLTPNYAMSTLGISISRGPRECLQSTQGGSREREWHERLAIAAACAHTKENG